MDYDAVVATLFIILVIIGWIIAIPTGVAYFIVFIMCKEKKNCKRDDCCLRGFCNRTALSDKEREVFRKKLESMDDVEEERK